MSERLMPDPEEARASGLMDDYGAWRRYWAEAVLGLSVGEADEADA